MSLYLSHVLVELGGQFCSLVLRYFILLTEARFFAGQRLNKSLELFDTVVRFAEYLQPTVWALPRHLSAVYLVSFYLRALALEPAASPAFD